MTSDPTNLSLAELAVNLRANRLSARDLAEASIANHGRRDDTLKAYKAWEPDRFRAEAGAADAAFAAGYDLGPLQGIPASVKDLYGLAGYRTFAGTPRSLPEAWEREGPVVRALRRQLVPVSGKTHTVEFAFGGLGTNAHWGTPRNPWDAKEHRVPGGSSSGAGVSLWEGSAFLALGSDTAGSVRVPASFTGTVGLKTTFGRWSVDGVVPLSPSLDTAGVLTRSVADAVVAFAVIDPLVEEPALAMLERFGRVDVGGLSIGICDWFFEGCESGIDDAVHAAVKELAPLNPRVVKVDGAEVAEAGTVFGRGGLAAPEFAAFITNDLPDWKESLDPIVRARFERMEAITAVEYLGRRGRLAGLTAAFEQRMAEIDVVVAPTVPISPPLLSAVGEVAGYQERNMLALRNTAIGNLLCLCGVTLPVGLDSNGMPVGLMVMGPRGADDRILAVALAFERVLGTARQRLGAPPLCGG